MRLEKITLALDMGGCPNRCLHCWLGRAPNRRLKPEDLREAAAAFRPCCDVLEVFSWYREPDYREDYRALWALEAELSDEETLHFELASVWRLARDPDYAPWLAGLDVQACQLTLFGGEETTDRFCGRVGAYQDILAAIDALLRHGIAPRVQVFADKENIEELYTIPALIKALRLEERCASIGRRFEAFVHQGSCDGANELRYDTRMTPDDIGRLPKQLLEYACRYFGTEEHSDIFGRTEREWLLEMEADHSTVATAGKRPVLYIDGSFDVYPNSSAPEPHWRLGNLREGGAAAILEAYWENRSSAQHVRKTMPLSVLAATVGNPESERLFSRGDYITYLLNRYCKQP